ncbi:MAG: sugar phosphate isomerase/epimerase [Planctomycetaceae bacterium]|nr:sugar phosphate isomerase/epimerase [Planctomycetaceae bacterium]
MSRVPATSSTRRAFLHRTAAAAGAGVGLSLTRLSSAAGQGQFAGEIRKAVKYHMVQGDGLSVRDKFQLLKDLGFDGVEIRSVDRVDPDEAVRARDETGLPIHGVINSNSPLIREAVDLSKKYGGDSVLVVAGRVNQEMSYDANYREWLGRLRENAPYAEEQGIQLLVENVWNNFLLSPLEMARFIDEVDSPAVGVYFDVGNVVRYGWPEQWVRILGHRIGKLDIKEYSRKLEQDEGIRKGFQVEIGDGDVNYPALLEALAEIGYSGWATAEVPGGDRERLAEIARRMDVALDLKTAAE